MPTWRKRLRLIVRDSGAIRFAELRLGVLSWPESGVTRNRERRQLAEGFLHRHLGEVPGAEGDALQHVPELLRCGNRNLRAMDVIFTPPRAKLSARHC
jgi:hypothetical protein